MKHESARQSRDISGQSDIFRSFRKIVESGVFDSFGIIIVINSSCEVWNHQEQSGIEIRLRILGYLEVAAGEIHSDSWREISSRIRKSEIYLHSFYEFSGIFLQERVYLGIRKTGSKSESSVVFYKTQQQSGSIHPERFEEFLFIRISFIDGDEFRQLVLVFS